MEDNSVPVAPRSLAGHKGTTGPAPGPAIAFYRRTSEGRSAVLGRMAETGDCDDEDKRSEKGGMRERQGSGAGKRHRDVRHVMVGDTTDRAIIIVIAPVVVMMEGCHQNREQHEHRQRKSDGPSALRAIQCAVPA